MTRPPTPDELLTHLAQCTGTEQYHRTQKWTPKFGQTP